MPKNWCFWTVVLEKTLESHLDNKEIQSVRPKGNQSWIFIRRTDAEAEVNSNPLATWCEELTHWKRPWCWERLKAGGEGDDRGCDSWMASPTRRTRVWASFRRWWRTRKPGVLQSMGLQRVGHDWATELNWTDAYKVRGPQWKSSRLICSQMICRGAVPLQQQPNLETWRHFLMYSFFLILIFITIYLFLAVLGLPCCTWTFPSSAKWELL